MFYFLCLETALWHFRIIKNLYIVQRLFTKNKLNSIQTLMKPYMYKKKKFTVCDLKSSLCCDGVASPSWLCNFIYFMVHAQKFAKLLNFSPIWPLLQVVDLPKHAFLSIVYYYVHSNLDIVNKSVIPFLFTISNNLLYQM